MTNDWQPIATAPKDGTRLILGALTGGEMLVSSGYWANYNGGGWFSLMARQPTHWMHLPGVPTT